jgi:hypothetical protein
MEMQIKAPLSFYHENGYHEENKQQIPARMGERNLYNTIGRTVK